MSLAHFEHYFALRSSANGTFLPCFFCRRFESAERAFPFDGIYSLVQSTVFEMLVKFGERFFMTAFYLYEFFKEVRDDIETFFARYSGKAGIYFLRLFSFVFCSIAECFDKVVFFFLERIAGIDVERGDSFIRRRRDEIVYSFRVFELVFRYGF